MKRKYIYSCLMVLALASGCIKVEGDEPYTITRQIRTVDENTGEGYNQATVMTSANAYMYGDAEEDVLVESDHTRDFDNQNRLVLDCYVTLSSKFMNLNLSRNAIEKAGYVYSRTDKRPVVNQFEENFFWVEDSKAVDPSKTDLAFSATGHHLDFDVTYYMRSFLISTKGDTIYNPRAIEVKTVLPHDVWFQRKGADLAKRTEAFCCQAGEKTYMYGGRSGSVCFNEMYEYDTKSDTWRQLATYEDNKLPSKAKRANGASFAYKKAADEYLIYIAGGRLNGTGKLTSTVFFFDTKNNRFNDYRDHPNHGRLLPVYDENGKPVLKKDKDGNVIEPYEQLLADGSRDYVESLPVDGGFYTDEDYYGLEGCVGFVLPDEVKGYRYFVAFGKSNSTNADAIETAVYEYEVLNDRNGSDGAAWKNITLADSRSTIGFYQPVCITCGDRIIIGTGETTKIKGNGVSSSFYTISVETVNTLTFEPFKIQPPVDFSPRANAAGFYLSYEEDHEYHERLYVGTGRSVKESNYTGFELLNDLWSYDFVTQTWQRMSNCSNIYRQGACGFTVLRQDDDYTEQGGSRLRGFFSFGEGSLVKEVGGEVTEQASTLNDNWEYLP